MTTWRKKLPFFRDGQHYTIFDRLYQEAADRIINEYGDISDDMPEYILPYGEAQIFKALELTPPHKTRVVILGQDPYPTPGHANGLAFSVNATVRPLPRSLQNIYRELVDDLGVSYPPNGDLTPWADQGVLLLNTSLTVAPMQAGSHLGYGWEGVTEQILEYLADYSGKVFILWGRHAQSFEPLINTRNNLIIKSPHPSPLSAHYGFFGSRPFSKANAFLEKPINWDLSNGPGRSQRTTPEALLAI